MSTRAASPALMAVRSAVARCVADLDAGSAVMVACSGGPDSLALAGATAWVGERKGLGVVAVVVDHGLQQGSPEVARDAADACRDLGVERVEIVAVVVGSEGGPEAAARTARYEALAATAAARGASAVLLGHTLEDQAETVLLRLARGSGARSLSAMRARNDPWRRPFLALPRADVQAAAAQMLAPLGRTPWADPHNDDPAYSRVRVRALLDDLRAAAGPGAVLGLTRSADLLRDDADALDSWATSEYGRLVTLDDSGPSADCDALLALPRAVRTRVIREMCVTAGSPVDVLTFEHVSRVEALVGDWRGQGETRLPGGVIAGRAYGRLCLRSP